MIFNDSNVSIMKELPFQVKKFENDLQKEMQKIEILTFLYYE